MTEQVGEKVKQLLGKGDQAGAIDTLAIHLGKTLTGILPKSEAPNIAKDILHKLGHIKL